MSSVYRNATPPADPAEEPLPAFRAKVTVAGVAIVVLPRLAVLGLAVGLSTNFEELTMRLLYFGGPYLVGATVLLLERPVRDWLARRYARRVARGVLELERRVF